MFLGPFHSTSPSVTTVDGCPLGTDRFPSVVSALGEQNHENIRSVPLSKIAETHERTKMLHQLQAVRRTDLQKSSIDRRYADFHRLHFGLFETLDLLVVE